MAIHAYIWGFHGNMHIAWGFYYITLHLIHCSLQNIDESVLVCPVPMLCPTHTFVHLRTLFIITTDRLIELMVGSYTVLTSGVLTIIFQVALLLDLHTAVNLAPVVWTCLMEGTATVIESVGTAITIHITTAALTILAKVY